MLNLLKDMNTKADAYYRDMKAENKSHRFYLFLLGLFGLFILAGVLLGYLLNSQMPNTAQEENNALTKPAEKSYEGRISYVDPNRYPDQNISYVLVDAQGKLLYLLKSKDQKLVVAEGHWAKVFGNVDNTPIGDVVTVERVVIKQKQ